jgi:hypothetical protein
MLRKINLGIMVKAMDEREFLSELLDTDKVERVRVLLEEYLGVHAVAASWVPIGGRRNNSGTIQAAGDPARALIERITNGVDAVIERAHVEHSGKPICTTPKEATQSWFGVPSAGLHKLSEAERRSLAQNSVFVILHEGNGRAKRTVDIADKGLGLTAEQMPQTILSLNESNKLDKFYLAGAFGQGGSASFASSDYTLIASRSILTPEIVSFTIVRYDPPEGVKLGSYVYLVKDAQVLQLTSILPEFADFSTHIRHYGYDLHDYSASIGPSSLYGRFQTILFEPVLPFWFSNRVHKWGRTIKGSRTALNGAREEGDSDSKLSYGSPLFFSDLGEFGQIGIEYWVLEPNPKSAPNRSFVNGTKPIVITVNGQTHAEWSATILRKEVDLLHLTPRMAVHLDCNRLSLDAKRALFVSNREESRKGIVQNLILQEMINALKADERLAELNEQARLATSRVKDENAEREVRKEVAKMLKLLGFAVSEEVGGRKAKSGGEGGKVTPHKPRPRPAPIAVNEPPSFIEIVDQQPVRFYPGQRRFLRIRTDAHSKYHNASNPTESRFSFLTEGERIRFAGSSELRDGHMRAAFAVDVDAPVGGSGKITVELRPVNAPTLSASVQYTVVPSPPVKTSGAVIALPEIDCEPIDSMESEEWVTWNWPNDVAEVAADYAYSKEHDRITIRYSTLFPRFRSVRESLGSRDQTKAQSFQRRYQIWLTTNVLVHWQDTLQDLTTLTEAELEADQVDDYRRDEIRRMAKVAVLYAQRDVAHAMDSMNIDLE